MPRKMHLLLLLPLLAFTAYFIFKTDPQHLTVKFNGISDLATIEVELARQLFELEPSSEEYRKTSAAIKKVREKAAKTIKSAENSEPFLEALAQIKTAPGGQTYKINYRKKALQRARALSFDLKKGRSGLASSRLLDWKERGPGNVSGRTQAIVIDKSDASGNTWFTASIGGGIWKTTDAGATWQHKSPELSIYSTGAIVQSESNPDVLYIGTGMGYGRVVEPGRQWCLEIY